MGAKMVSGGKKVRDAETERREKDRETGARRPSLQTSAGIRHSWLASL